MPSYIYSDFTPTLKKKTEGDVDIKYDVDVVFMSLRNIMATVSGERIRNPIGSTLVGFLFEPVSEDVAADMIAEIKRIIALYEPRIINLRVTATPYPDDLYYDVKLRFGILGLDGSQVMNAPLRAFGNQEF